jgi:hypothetical protein
MCYINMTLNFKRCVASSRMGSYTAKTAQAFFHRQKSKQSVFYGMTKY